MTQLICMTALAAAIVAAIGVCALAQESAPASQAGARGADAPKVQPKRQPDKEVVYKTVAEHQPTNNGELKLFVYLPEGWKAADKRPAIVFFFGGGWEMGTPGQFYAKAEYLASRGMVAFCAEYRVMSRNRTTIDKCVEDARSAMRFVRSHAGDWGVDPDKLVSSGGSAGGHLGACVALLDGPDDPADDLKVSCKPQAMVLFNPVMDLDCMWFEERLAKHAMNVAAGDSDAAKKAAIKKLSPIEYVKKGDAPMIIMFGRYDDFLKDAVAYAAKSLPMGNRVEIWVAPRIGHGFFNASPWHEATLIKTDEFLASLGYLKGAATIKPADEKAVLTQEIVSPQTRPAAATRP